MEAYIRKEFAPKKILEYGCVCLLRAFRDRMSREPPLRCRDANGDCQQGRLPTCSCVLSFFFSSFFNMQYCSIFIAAVAMHKTFNDIRNVASLLLRNVSVRKINLVDL